ncbi:MAG: hypothetical protein AB7K09_18455 [Planctomycetota bacterium]
MGSVAEFLVVPTSGLDAAELHSVARTAFSGSGYVFAFLIGHLSLQEPPVELVPDSDGSNARLTPDATVTTFAWSHGDGTAVAGIMATLSRSAAEWQGHWEEFMEDDAPGWGAAVVDAINWLQERLAQIPAAHVGVLVCE